MPRIAVEDSLTEVKKMLRENGYEVVNLGNWQQLVDAVVITGRDVNIMSDQSKSIAGAPVINADGKTVNEVFHAVNVRVAPGHHR